MSWHNSEIDAHVDVLGLWNLHSTCESREPDSSGSSGGSARCDVPLCRLDRHLDFLVGQDFSL